MNAIEIERLSKRYQLGEDRPGGSLAQAASRSLRRLVGMEPRPQRDQVWALRDIDVRVPEGEALGIIGRNGAGKSTLLKVLSRITEPTSGVTRTRGRVASLLEVGTGFHPELTGRENVYLNGAILGMTSKTIAQRFDQIVSFAGVDRFIDTPVKRYSSGMYLRLAFAVAAHLEPDILVVDEVLAVGDAAFQTKCLSRMEKAEREGRTVVFVSHNLWAITRLCTRVIWLENGRLQGDGAASEVTENYLAAQTSRPAEQPRTAHGAHDVVRLLSVRVLNESGTPAAILRRDQPFTIEIRFSAQSSIPGLDLAAWIINSEGSEILSEAWSDTAPERGCEKGEYIAVLRVPPLINVGNYIVGVWMGTAYETILTDSAGARFRLEGDVMDRPKRAVVLGLPWAIRQIHMPEDGSPTMSRPR